uniref:polypeptide N-acetylgalactosaminyltransferase 5 n=1 Tax=Agelaius phoeniceus TaxID=39638 RepID=UPI0023EE1C87|nr:polypeptide N-acetylgalactosaminyltransferase 5 [Agelaius phoeniceus]
MSGLRRLFRGSGRALALVFAASVAWLLLDMAALRLSLGEAGGRLLREAPRAVGTTLRATPQGDVESTENLLKKAVTVHTLRLPLLGPLPGLAGAGRWGRHQEQPLERLALARMSSSSGEQLLEQLALNRMGRNSGEQPLERLALARMSRNSGEQLLERLALTRMSRNSREQLLEQLALAGICRSKGEQLLERLALAGMGRNSGEQLLEQLALTRMGRNSGEQLLEQLALAGICRSKGEQLLEQLLERLALARMCMSKGEQFLQQLDGQEQAGSSPGMHRVLSMDATLAPRDPRAPGQFGHPVAVPDDKQEEAKSRWKEGNFNVYLSDLIPVDRAIADTRPAGCSEQQVHDDLPTTSVIMCFVDEVWSALLRSVHSVLSRSPPRLLEEIILVDDCSTKEYLKEQLDVYMSRFPKVKVLHLRERHGLIRARLAGAEIATGAVLTFLDSHVECNVGWLEPLLERVRLRRTKVACPVIEVISDRDMSYMTVDNFQRGIFTWPMNFGWRQIPQEVIEKNKIKETDIIRCPVMAGGLFSIDKKYFSELGMYDPGLDVWGGENMEISFKVWMCGGEIEIVPCSRVGHIFRNDNPYSFPRDRVRTVERNLARVAEVWLDEYKELFYGHAYHLLHSVDVGDLSQQIRLRQRLRCRTFHWYLQNVYPDLEAPLVKASGQLANVALAGCIAVEGTALAFEKCDANSTNQKFNYTWLRLIQHGELCLAPAGVLGALGLRQCSAHLVSQHPRLPQQPACLEVDAAFRALRLRRCEAGNPRQKWQFSRYHAD